MMGKYKLNSILIISLIVTIVLSLGITPAVVAATGDSITPTSISAIPTFECIGVTVDYSGDNNQNSTGILEYRQSGGTWKTAPEMYADRSEREYRGNIFWLAANTQYEIRVTLSDADGGGTISTATTTRNDNPTIGTNNIYVATNGSDTTGNGSLSIPTERYKRQRTFVPQVLLFLSGEERTAKRLSFQFPVLLIVGLRSCLITEKMSPLPVTVHSDFLSMDLKLTTYELKI